MRHRALSTIVLFIIFATPFYYGVLRIVKCECLLIPYCSHNSVNFESVYLVPLSDWMHFIFLIVWFFYFSFPQLKLGKRIWLVPHELHPNLSWVIINKTHIIHISPQWCYPYLSPNICMNIVKKPLCLVCGCLELHLYCFPKTQYLHKSSLHVLTQISLIKLHYPTLTHMP